MKFVPDALTASEAALAAAEHASRATAELLRFARDGEFGAGVPFAEEVAEKLATALALAIGIDGDGIFKADEHPDHHAREAALRKTLRAACIAFVEESPA